MKLQKQIICAGIFLTVSLFNILPVLAVDNAVESGATPRQKSELVHVLKKFATSMGLVVGSCAILYFALRTYKRFKEQETGEEETYLVDVTKDLTTPETIEDATKFFIEKF